MWMQRRWQKQAKLGQKYLAAKLLEDWPKYAKKAAKNFDADEWLEKVGLTTYKPKGSFFGGFGLFFFGAAVGSLVALFYAPKPGSDLRVQVKDRAKNYLHKVDLSTTEAQAHA